MTNLVRSYLIVTDNEVVGYDDLPTFLPCSAWNALSPIIEMSQRRFELGELAVDGQLVLPHGHDFLVDEDDFEEGFIVETWLPEWDSSEHPQQCVQNQLDPLVSLFGGFTEFSGGDDVFVKAYPGATEGQLFPGMYPYHLVVSGGALYDNLYEFEMRLRLTAFNGGKDMVINHMSSAIVSERRMPMPPVVPVARPSGAHGRPAPQPGGVYKNAPARKPQMDQAMNPQTADGCLAAPVFGVPPAGGQYGHKINLGPEGAHSMTLGNPPKPGDHTHSLSLDPEGAHSNSLEPPKRGWDYKSEYASLGKSVKKEEPEEEGSLYERLRGVKPGVIEVTPQSKDDQEEVRRRVEESKKIINNMFAF